MYIMDTALSNDPKILDALPELFKQWADSLPLADLLKLSEVYGGTRLYIPKTLHESHALAASLGEDAARRLIEFAGGDEVAVPLCHKARRLVRCREAWQLHEHGQTLAVIAKHFRVTDRTVMEMIRRGRTIQAPAIDREEPAHVPS
jgi:Mor family transcriptional regulator